MDLPLSLGQTSLQYPHLPDFRTYSPFTFISVGHQSPLGSLCGFAQPSYSILLSGYFHFVSTHLAPTTSPPFVRQTKMSKHFDIQCSFTKLC